jgi:hypothetical protein
MSQFLSGEPLSQAIREIVAGRNVRCAVAFWGEGAVLALFGSRKANQDGPQMICDLSMGCTSPSELTKLGAPGSPHLRHTAGLHAKVHISDAGVIVGSAKASSNGIGWPMGTVARLIEAGTLHNADSPVWNKASEWFERDHAKATIIGSGAIYLLR